MVFNISFAIAFFRMRSDGTLCHYPHVSLRISPQSMGEYLRAVEDILKLTVAC